MNSFSSLFKIQKQIQANLFLPKILTFISVSFNFIPAWKSETKILLSENKISEKTANHKGFFDSRGPPRLF
jgi:hypothetical protein